MLQGVGDLGLLLVSFFFFFFFFLGGGGFGLWDSGLISLALWGLRPETPRQ